MPQDGTGLILFLQVSGSLVLFYNINFMDNNPFYDKTIASKWNIFGYIIIWNSIALTASFIFKNHSANGILIAWM